MYLSDAIDMGSLQSNQGFGALVDSQGNRCAWGGAYQAMGVEIVTMKQTRLVWKSGLMTYGIEMPQSIPLDWKWAFTRKALCPCCEHKSPSDVHVISTISAHLNDQHKWTRPRIADWVRQQEIHFGIRKEEDATVSAPRSEVEHQGVLVSDCR